MRARRKTAQDEHTELERSVEQLRHDRCEIELGEGDEAVARRGGSIAYRLQCVTPCRKPVGEVASPLATEAARASTSWHHRRKHRSKPWNRLASEGHSPSRVRRGMRSFVSEAWESVESGRGATALRGAAPTRGGSCLSGSEEPERFKDTPLHGTHREPER